MSLSTKKKKRKLCKRITETVRALIFEHFHKDEQKPVILSVSWCLFSETMINVIIMQR